jgi:transaldolase
LFEDHGVIARRLGYGLANDAEQVMDALAEGGIDLDDVNRTLENEGIDKFTKSFDRLLRLIGDKRKAFAREVLESLPGSLV